MPALLLISSVFFFNFLARIILGPLMPVVETDLGLGHGGAGRIFLCIGLGNAAGLLLSGLASSRLGHRTTIALSAMAAGVAALLAAGALHPLWFRLALAGIGASAGIYLPSGIASLLSAVRPQDAGKGVAVHEMAPNLAFIAAPLLAEAGLALAGWRPVLVALGIGQLALGLVFLRRSATTRAPGRPLSLRFLAEVARRPAFLLLAALFCLAAAGSFSPYSMLTLYLTDMGRPRPEVNQLLSLSRVLAFCMPFAAGVLVDRIGPRPVAAMAFACNGLVLAGLALASGTALTALVVAQPMLAMLFYPAGFAALGRLFTPQSRSAAVSLITPLSILCGVGLVPLAMGLLGEAGMFRAAYGLVAGLCLAGAPLALLLRLPDD
jgi:NNP family nitrate/nitrite transporter-like MFS transporter